MRHLLQNIASLLGTLAIFGAPLGMIAFVAFSGDSFLGPTKDQSLLVSLTSVSKVSIISVLAVFLVGVLCFFLYKFSRMLQRTADKMDPAYDPAYDPLNRPSSKWLGEGGEGMDIQPEPELGVFRKPPKLHSAWEDFGKTKQQLDKEEEDRRRRVNRSLAPYIYGESEVDNKSTPSKK